MKTIIFGMNRSSSETKICATCQYWGGPNVLQNVSDRSYNKFLITNMNANGLCLKKHIHKRCLNNCNDHTYHYSLQPYV